MAINTIFTNANTQIALQTEQNLIKVAVNSAGNDGAIVLAKVVLGYCESNDDGRGRHSSKTVEAVVLEEKEFRFGGEAW